MVFHGIVVGRGPNLSRNAALEVGHFLGAFVHQQNHDKAFRVVFDYAERDIAQEGGFARAGWGNNEAARAFSNRAEQVDDAIGHATIFHLELELLVGRDRSEGGEIHRATTGFKIQTVHFFDKANLWIGKAGIRRG